MKKSAMSEKMAALARIVTAISDITRWRILAELSKGEALPTGELAKRLAAPATNISKHLTYLHRIGILQRGFGKLYRIAERYVVAGERTLDFGVAVLRLDRVPER
jgi:hypothetical protein